MHILVNTGGGDAPGLNAVIRAVTLSALRRGWKVTGIKRGYHGLLEPSGTGLVDLTRDKVRGIAHLGGTILGTVNKGHPFEFIVTRDGKQITMDISDQIMQRFKEVKADALIAIGGDGAFRIASRFGAKGMPIVGVPKTIDNDLSHTQASPATRTSSSCPRSPTTSTRSSRASRRATRAVVGIASSSSPRARCPRT